ncbi:hypothetical protein H0H92_012448 [Tricholoma furcatifolium]|nr:hypothetical protein H0H92_012448 [Tricholoma furcatifolium]
MEAAPPLSFPSILRNPGLSERFSHLQENAPRPHALTIKKVKREHEGKRWIRRKENARFVGNPHIVGATKRDYLLPTPQTRPTFPEPLPTYLSRTAKIPSSVLPEPDKLCASAGRFSLSLKGMRKGLRKCGFRAELLVRDVEYEIVEWLEQGGTVLNPDLREGDDLAAVGVPVGETGTIFELSRTPLQLVWCTNDDSFARYVVHCCARYHEIVSFSKEHSGKRLTYLLRPNVTRPNHHTTGVLDTPPVTDIDYSSHPDTESDHGELETDSDVEQISGPPTSHLPTISEGQSPVHSPVISPHRMDEDTWSLVGDTDREYEDDDSPSDAELAAGISTVSLEPDLDATPKAKDYLREKASHRHRVVARARASSSPSRSPVRRPFHSMPRRHEPRISTLPLHQQLSFYDYLFS